MSPPSTFSGSQGQPTTTPDNASHGSPPPVPVSQTHVTYLCPSVFRCCFIGLGVVLTAAAWALHFLAQNALPVQLITFSFLAIIINSQLLARAMDNFSSRCSSAVTTVIYATLGNIVEFVVALLALRKGNVTLVHTLLIGSIFIKLLVELGLYYTTRGFRRRESAHGSNTAGLEVWSSVPLMVAVLSLFVSSAASHFAIDDSSDDHGKRDIDAQDLRLSRPFAIVLAVVYLIILSLYELQAGTLPLRTARRQSPRDENEVDSVPLTGLDGTNTDEERGALATNDRSNGNRRSKRIEQMVWGLLVGILIVLIGFTAEFMVDDIDSITKSSPLGEVFIGRILLPLVGNIPEIYAAVVFDAKASTTRSRNVVAQSITQMILGVIALLVLIGWVVNVPLSLVFGLSNTIQLMVAAGAAFAPLPDSPFMNILRGVILLCSFVMYAMLLWYYTG